MKPTSLKFDTLPKLLKIFVPEKNLISVTKDEIRKKYILNDRFRRKRMKQVSLETEYLGE